MFFFLHFLDRRRGIKVVEDPWVVRGTKYSGVIINVSKKKKKKLGLGVRKHDSIMMCYNVSKKKRKFLTLQCTVFVWVVKT